MYKKNSTAPTAGRRLPRSKDGREVSPIAGAAPVSEPAAGGGGPGAGGWGLLVVRRGITPGLGELALPGGYIGMGETWQEAGAREVWEETGLRLDPAEIEDFTALTAWRAWC